MISGGGGGGCIDWGGVVIRMLQVVASGVRKGRGYMLAV